MQIKTETQAFAILDDFDQTYDSREAAGHYLASHPTPQVTRRFIQALKDPDFVVRWIAAEGLATFGSPAQVELLKELTNAQNAGDAWFRQGAYHVLHRTRNLDPRIDPGKLMSALRGSAPGISTMEEASKLLRQIDMF
jgi:HEAT repeat protein